MFLTSDLPSCDHATLPSGRFRVALVALKTLARSGLPNPDNASLVI